MELNIKTIYSVGDHVWRMVDKKPAEFVVRAIYIKSEMYYNERQKTDIQYELRSVEKVDKSLTGSLFYMTTSPLESDLEGKYFPSKTDLVISITKSLMD